MGDTETTKANRLTYRDCFSSALLDRVQVPAQDSSRPKRSLKLNEPKSETDADELADFIEYLAFETFEALPPELKSLTYSIWLAHPKLQATYAPASPSFDDAESLVPPDVSESLSAYDLLTPGASLSSMFTSALSEYVAAVAAPSPVWLATRAAACEICQRGWMPLTYHHLIPKDVHEKVLKRKWHEEWRLNSVAWLCRACHSFVHRVASNEELARHFWTVDLLMEREDVRAWATWVGRIRWKAK